MEILRAVALKPRSPLGLQRKLPPLESPSFTEVRMSNKWSYERAANIPLSVSAIRNKSIKVFSSYKSSQGSTQARFISSDRLLLSFRSLKKPRFHNRPLSEKNGWETAISPQSMILISPD